MEPRIIDYLQCPRDLHALDDEQLAIVAQEVREQIVRTASTTGGHVSSSLGAVDLIVACHAELDCPHDRLVFDVGHQAYAHKILTGRLAEFDTLRTEGGISGFPTPAESPYDTHWSGHASDALSIAAGLARARDLSGGDERIVTVIGDASISGGMAFEALNEIGQDRTRMVIVLNDNGMSISRNVGGLSRHLSYLRATSDYRSARDELLGNLSRGGAAGQVGLDLARSARYVAKSLLLPETSMMFERLGITCTSPVDGHDISALRHVLREALASNGPVLVHAITQKGHGYEPAVTHPKIFHGVGPFDAATGEVAPKQLGYSDVMAQTLARETEAGADVVAITAAMKDGTGLAAYGEEFPERLVDVGICEEHAMGLAAGLAIGGKRPVVALYSAFLQRTLDQIIVNVALPALNVVLCVDRAGIVGADGPTHNGSFDLAYLRMIPHMRILVPSSAAELASAAHTALALEGPIAIRYPRAGCEEVAAGDERLLEVGRSTTLREGGDVAVLAFGSMVAPALAAADSLAERGIEATVVDMRWAKPLDLDAVRRAATARLVVTVEDGCVMGGIGEEIASELGRMDAATSVLTLGLPDHFVAQGTIAQVHHELGLDAEGIEAAITQRLTQD